MMRRGMIIAALLMWAVPAAAEDIRIENAYVPPAPPGVMSHAAYLTITNPGLAPQGLIGVRAEGYGMAHLHRSEENDGVATMTMLHQLDIAPGQTVTMTPGGLHIMLMRPEGTLTMGDTVALTLIFANGKEVAVAARVETHGQGS